MHQDQEMTRPLAVNTAVAIRSVAWTIIGDITFGRICLKIIRASEAPSAFTASMYSSFRTVKVDPRTIRANAGTENTPTAIMTFVKLPPRTLTIASASRIPGNARKYP